MSLFTRSGLAADSAGSSLRDRLWRPIDPASLVFFRVGFGLLIAWEMKRYLDHYWVVRYYQEPELLFKYWLFGWVHPLPGLWLPLAFAAIGLAGLLVAAGLFYRVSAAVVFVGLWYIFLLDKARYLNHWYLLILIALLMLFMPAGRAYSLDALRKGGFAGSSSVPIWSVWLLRFQIGVVFFYGGLGKLNADWLRGEPIATWLANRQEFPLIGSWFGNRAVGVGIGYTALAFDLLVVFFLLFRRTRPYAFIAAIGFSLMNDSLFHIGLFPWFMLVGTMMFFEPDWPKQVWADLRSRNLRGMVFAAGFVAGLVIGATFPRTFVPIQAVIAAVACGLAVHQLLPAAEPRRRVAESRAGGTGSRLAVGLIVAWVAIQLLVPLRHFVIPGNVHWTEEGHRYSWHMKLRDKDGIAAFIVVWPETNEFTVVDPNDFLSSRQADRVAAIPDMAVQFANYLEEVYAEGTDADLVVLVDGLVTLNGRDPQRLIDPEVDLTRVSVPTFGADWIIPLDA
ncbi:MAG: HTTM domain-containing protein [Acidobacteria bacterium]|nr:HTTM domain-containing protein [Acidobacteriota bacterium]